MSSSLQIAARHVAIIKVLVEGGNDSASNVRSLQGCPPRGGAWVASGLTYTIRIIKKLSIAGSSLLWPTALPSLRDRLGLVVFALFPELLPFG